MKNDNMNNKLTLIALLVFCVQFGFAQNYSEDEKENNNSGDTTISGTKVTPDFFQNIGLNTVSNAKTATLKGNLISIRQVGELNTAAIYTETNASEINLVQYGDANNVALEYRTNTAVADLVQNGNNNNIEDFVLKRNENVSLDLTQKGDNLNFERHGVNRITRNLKFRQTEASPTIIIRSYN